MIWREYHLKLKGHIAGNHQNRLPNLTPGREIKQTEENQRRWASDTRPNILLFPKIASRIKFTLITVKVAIRTGVELSDKLELLMGWEYLRAVERNVPCQQSC